MKKIVYYCDRCKKQTNKPVRVYAHDVDLVTDDPGAERMAAVELCPDCTQKVIDLLRGGLTNYEAICKLYRDGKEIPDIELATGIPCAAISRVVAKEGLAAERYPADEDHKLYTKEKRKHTIITDELIEKMVDLLMAGDTYEQIAKEVGVSLMTVRRYLKDRKEVEQIDLIFCPSSGDGAQACACPQAVRTRHTDAPGRCLRAAGGHKTDQGDTASHAVRWLLGA